MGDLFEKKPTAVPGNLDLPKLEAIPGVIYSKQELTQLDRINYSFGVKINLGDYESADVHISLSSDVSAGKTREETLTELKTFVEGEVQKRYQEIKAKKEAPKAPVQAQVKAQVPVAPQVQEEAVGSTAFCKFCNTPLMKQTKKYSEKSPDYKCDCGGAGWVNISKKTGESYIAWKQKDQK